MNRPPQPADSWWKQHESRCGGSFTKISEPEPVKKEKSAKKQKEKKEVKREKGQKTLEEVFKRRKTDSSKSCNDEVIILDSDSEEQQEKTPNTSDTALTLKPKGEPPRHLRPPSTNSSAVTSQSLSCPICSKPGFTQHTINDHIDTCIM